MTVIALPVKVDYLEQCATRVHHAYQRSLDALGQSVDAYFDVGHALADARSELRTNQAFGLWFRDQEFGFSRQWAHVLRQAAEMEPQVRAAFATQVANGKPNIRVAVRDARRAAIASTNATAAPPSETTEVTPITTRRSIDDLTALIRQYATLGLKASQIADELGISLYRVYDYAAKAGIPIGKKSRLAKAQRIQQMRVLAKQGATSSQIAAELGVDKTVVRHYRDEHNIEIPADATVGKVYRPIDSTRIVTTAIDTIDGIGVMFDQIDYSMLPCEDIDGWVTVLNDSIRCLTTLRNRLKEMTQP